jgi:hypothetical protein
MGRDSDGYEGDLLASRTGIFLQKGLDSPTQKRAADLPGRQIRGGPTENAGEGPPSSDTPASPARPRIFLDEQAINF